MTEICDFNYSSFKLIETIYVYNSIIRQINDNFLQFKIFFKISEKYNLIVEIVV